MVFVLGCIHPEAQDSTGTCRKRKSEVYIMLNVTVTGKVVKVEAKNPAAGRTETVVWMNERRYAGGAETHYVWIVLIPPFLEKAVANLCKEGKSIGFVAQDLWAQSKQADAEGTPIAAVIMAEQVFIL
jgi:hypothetical protein